jgi:hypothetical protein
MMRAFVHWDVRVETRAAPARAAAAPPTALISAQGPCGLEAARAGVTF